MRIPIAAICGLVQLVFAFPVDEEAALTSSSSDNFFLPRGVDLMNQQLDARNEGYSNSLSHQSPNPAEHTRSKLEARVTGNCLTMPDWANDISAGGYLGMYVQPSLFSDITS
jgi:hypothetical protein